MFCCRKIQPRVYFVYFPRKVLQNIEYLLNYHYYRSHHHNKVLSKMKGTSELKKSEIVNSILMKELRESKNQIATLKREIEIL